MESEIIRHKGINLSVKHVSISLDANKKNIFYGVNYFSRDNIETPSREDAVFGNVV